MSILSNYVPNCITKAWVRCPIEELEAEEGLSKRAFAEKICSSGKYCSFGDLPRSNPQQRHYEWCRCSSYRYRK